MDQFNNLGYLGPVSALTRDQCDKLIALHRQGNFGLAPDWSKAMAVYSPEIFRIACKPEILDVVRGLLGHDIMLWGASFVQRMPGHVHPWHNDIESSVDKGRTVSVWIGLKNTSLDTGLQLISRSHIFRESIQEARHVRGVERDIAAADEVLKWAREKDPECALKVPDIGNGDALFFDGWIWHGTHNLSGRKRTALLLQYATPDAPIRIPDPNFIEWPFRTLSYPKPPCIMVSGSDSYGVNRIVPAPVTHDGVEKQSLTTRMYSIDLPLKPDEGKGWKPFPLFRGSTPNLQGMICHVSALNKGETPHPPHHHREDEILIVLQGEADVTLPDLARGGEETVVPMKSGDFVFYPAWFYHTITGRSEEPVNYLMFKWYNTLSDTAANDVQKLSYGKYRFSDFVQTQASDKPIKTQIVFQGATDCLAHLQCHTTVLQPGAGYPAHIDAHDVAILIMQGEVESMGVRSGPGSVLYFASGELHDMRNPTDSSAKYLVFEFHGNHPPRVKRQRRTLWQKIRDPKSWEQKWKELNGRYFG